MSAQEFLDDVSSRIDAFVANDFSAHDSRVAAAARYALAAGGKRLRPALVFATALTAQRARSFVELVEIDDLTRIGGAFEYIHTYSLIHDDLPVMDNDGLRRGRPSCHIAWGVPTAVRAGLFLLAKAFAAVSRIGLPRRVMIIDALVESSGLDGMVGGQALDILSENRPADSEELLRIHRGKTAALIRGAVAAGALASDASEANVAEFAAVGSDAGLAFQIVDDLLDVESTAEAMGKPVGADSAKGKRTYPAVLGVETSRRRARELTDGALGRLQKLGVGDSILADLARFVLERRR